MAATGAGGGVRWPESAHDESTFTWKSADLIHAVAVSDSALTVARAMSAATARKVAAGVQRGRRMEHAVGDCGTVHGWTDVVEVRHVVADADLVVTHYVDGKRKRLTLPSAQGVPAADIFDAIRARLGDRVESREDARARRKAISGSISTGLGCLLVIGLCVIGTAGVDGDYRGRRSWLVRPVRGLVQDLGAGGLVLVALGVVGVTAALVMVQMKRSPEARILKVRAGDRRPR
jgi:hypothetical protein